MSGDKKPAIVVKDLTKSFKIPLDKGQGIKSKILGRAKKGYREFTPLNDVSFTVYEGDFFGIVGRNGSGKSTLLKTIAGIYEPTKGKVEVSGTLAPFIELGVGFNPQLTGRDNVYLNAAMLGFSREETDKMYDDIVDFAELHEFMEERLQNYSSGMQVRLAFSVAIRAEASILLLDEVLAVGDSAFQQKCFDYFEQLKNEKKTVILVTHNMSHVERFCNRGLLLNRGRIECIGSNDEVAKAYSELFAINKMTEDDTASQPRLIRGGETENDVLEISKVAIYQGDKETLVIDADGGAFDIALDIRWINKRYKNFNIAVGIRNERDMLVFSTSFGALEEKYIDFTDDKVGRIVFTVDNILGNGEYYINVSALGNDNETGARLKVLNYLGAASFGVSGNKFHTDSAVHPKIDAAVENITLSRLN